MISNRRSFRAPLVAVFVIASGALFACGGDDSPAGGGAGPANAGAGAGGQQGATSVAAPIVFQHKEQALPGFTYTTGLQPAVSPVQVGLTISAVGEAKIDAEGYALDGAVLKGRKGTGHVKIDGKFVIDGQVKADVAGIKYDGDLPGLKDVNIVFAADAPFEPYSIGKEVVAIAKVPAIDLPPIPLPGGLPGKLLLKIVEGSTVEIGFTGTCAGIDGEIAEYRGKVRRGGTVKLEATIALDVLGKKQDIPLPQMTLPVAGIATPIDLGKPKAVAGTPPADAGETASPSCKLGGGGAGGAGDAGASGAAGQSQGGNTAGGQAQGGNGQGGFAAGGQAQGGNGQGGQPVGGNAQGGNGQGGFAVGGQAQGGQAQGGNGQAGSGQAGMGQAGEDQGGSGGSGQAGTGQAGQGQGGSGQAGTGQAGQGQGGNGQAGTGQAGQGGQGQSGNGQAGAGGGAGSGQGGTNGGTDCVAISASSFAVVSSEKLRGPISPNVLGAGLDRLGIELYASPDGGTSSFTLGTGNNANYATCEQCVLVLGGDGSRFLATAGTLKLTKQSLVANAFSSGKLTNVRLQEVTIDPVTIASTPVANGRCFDLAETTWTVPTAACETGGTAYGNGPAACNACVQTEAAAAGCCGAVSAACDADPDCGAAVSCVANCANQACRDACADKYPEGRSIARAEQICLYGDGAFSVGACGSACVD